MASGSGADSVRRKTWSGARARCRACSFLDERRESTKFDDEMELSISVEINNGAAEDDAVQQLAVTAGARAQASGSNARREVADQRQRRWRTDRRVKLVRWR
ncbi:hypothetical protein Scep_023424 [Stephania cephalantha]|uniref:Uncharacterized protein n=1 Tax=Stephania cephalantha TaxID=152367 RepID=A0AAP0EV50_9MAGN